jgi:hypothetical protein
MIVVFIELAPSSAYPRYRHVEAFLRSVVGPLGLSDGPLGLSDGFVQQFTIA